MARLTELGTASAGATFTLGLRQGLDQGGSAKVTRPSVLGGVGGGLAALGLSMAAEARMIDPLVTNDRQMFADLAYNFGLGALTTGVFSAVYPKGRSGLQRPRL
jgi:hypothetical protein